MIEKLLDIEHEKEWIKCKVFILGHFGDRIPIDVQKEIWFMNQQQQKVIDKKLSKFKNSL